MAAIPNRFLAIDWPLKKTSGGRFKSISAFNHINQVFFQKICIFGALNNFNLAANMQMNVRKPPFVEIITLNFSFFNFDHQKAKVLSLKVFSN